MHFIIRLIFFVGKILVDMLTVILNGIIQADNKLEEFNFFTIKFEIPPSSNTVKC